METSYQATYKATQKLEKNSNTLLDHRYAWTSHRLAYNFLLSQFTWEEYIRTWIPMALPRGGPTSACHLECHLVEYVLFYMVIMEHVMKKQNGVKENFQVVYLQNRKVLEGIKLLFIFYWLIVAQRSSVWSHNP